MTTPNLEQIIAEHPYRINSQRVWCACGWDAYPDETPNGMDAHAAHVVAAIRDSGLTVIAPPEGKDYERICRSEQITVEDGDDGVPPIKWETPYDLRRLAPSAARALGAALIAAAQHAERNNP